MLERNNRVLIVDDNRAIHEDFRKILAGLPRNKALDDAEAVLFNQRTPEMPTFELTFALQGEEAVRVAQENTAQGRPYALAFVDMRMPPGIGGIETANRLWAISPHLQVVICSAYSDYGWSEISAQLGDPERWVILKKPFENIEVLQLSHALTAKWALQQEAQLRRAELEVAVKNRTEELQTALEQLRTETEERLRMEEHRRMVERKLEETQRLESLGVLAGGVAHDFNNILTAILGSASLARLDATPGSDLDENLQRIESGAKHAAGLCEQMLAYAGKNQMGRRDLDLNSLARETLDLLRVSLPKTAQLTTSFGASTPRIHGDPHRLRQVLMNLTLNAAESLGPARREVKLSTHSATLEAHHLATMTFRGEAQPGEFALLEVADAGEGMSPETLARIFEPFFTTKFTGRGLGLSAVLGIVRSHAGCISVSSTAGRGTTFRVYLPATTGELMPPDAPSSPAGAKQRGLRDGTVLVVDDEKAVRDVIGTALRSRGYQSVLAENGAEAVGLVERGPPNQFLGVLLDLTMPGMDGIATFRALQSSRAQLPVVLMSGFNQDEATRQFDGLPFSGFLRKPFSLEQLASACESFALPRSSSRTALPLATPRA